MESTNQDNKIEKLKALAGQIRALPAQYLSPGASSGAPTFAQVVPQFVVPAAVLDLLNEIEHLNSVHTAAKDAPFDCRGSDSDVAVIISRSTAQEALFAMKERAKEGRYQALLPDDASFARLAMHELDIASKVGR